MATHPEMVAGEDRDRVTPQHARGGLASAGRAVVDDVVVLYAQDATGQDRIPMIHQACIQCVIAPDVFEAVGELLT